MWEHLDPAEYQRRKTILEHAVVRGDGGSEEFPPALILEALARQESDEERALEMLRYEWNDDLPEGQTHTAANDPFTPPSMLRELVEDEECRPVLAANPSTPPDALRELYELEGGDLEELCTNVSTPPDVLRSLWEELGATEGLAEHPALPMELLEGILDEDLEIIAAAALNVSLGEEQFKLLESYEDPDPWRPSSDLPINLASNLAAPAEWLARPPMDQGWLETLSSDDDAIFRMQDIEIKIAQLNNPATPQSVIVEHAKDINPEVRAVVARHYLCPEEVRQILTTDPSPLVSAAAEDASGK